MCRREPELEDPADDLKTVEYSAEHSSLEVKLLLELIELGHGSKDGPGEDPLKSTFGSALEF